jgi:putative transposase
VTYEAIRKWCRKFGQLYANELRRRRPTPGDKWHLDEVFLTIHGARHYLWRAVDQDGYGFCRKFSFDSIWGMISLCHGS